ncbi:CHAT domain-containing protein [Suillus tomentosus]|nr:CHAT domain-containing protein [Suillus tomentosus]
MLQTRFERRGNHKDLDQAIAFQREALALCPVGHTNRFASLKNLANGLSSRFDQQGNDEDLDQAITLNREVLTLCLAGHTDQPTSLNNLAVQLSSRFDRRGNYEDLDQAIALNTEALALFPVGDTNQPTSLLNLTGQLSSRFDHRGNDEDLDEAIALDTEALALHPVGHTNRSTSLNSLATRLFSRFHHRGNYEDLDQAIALNTEALDLCPVGHTHQSMSLNNLAAQLSVHFEHQGNDEDLDQAIALHREALALHMLYLGYNPRPYLAATCGTAHYLVTSRSRSFPIAPLSGSHPRLRSYRRLRFPSIAKRFIAILLGQYSTPALTARLSILFDHCGNDEDLDQAITLSREALALLPVGNNEDLDEATTFDREALALHPVGHTDRSKSLNNLAAQLSVRFQHRGNNKDLNQAIALHKEALALCPVGHTGNDKDLDEAIALGTEALALCPVGHMSQFMSLSDLANKLSAHFEHQGNDEDLDQAIALHREALALCPVGHTYQPVALNRLASQLSTRFEHQCNKEDLDESRENLCHALTLLTQHDPRQLAVHGSLAEVYLLLHRSGIAITSTGENTDSLNAAMYHIKAAANLISGGLLSHLQASLLWAHHASEHLHVTQLEAYVTSMQLLDAYMSVTASVSARHNAMKKFSRTLAVDAAVCALRSGDVRRAVELLEQGRTIIWTQMAQLRMPLDSLQTCGDHAVTLMKRFRDLSSLLDKSPASRSEGTPRVDVEAEETQYRRRVKEWNRTVEDIWKIEGFSRFLLPPLFSDLQDVGRDGPIIVLIASHSSCDAIIITHKQPPTSIQLSTNFWKPIMLVLAFQGAVDKESSPKGNQPALIKALRELWNDVVRPVVENLGGFARRGSRIWWCPTFIFNFLLLHTAGEYRKDGESLSWHYISSYTPSLTALIKARASHDKPLSVPFVAIGQNLPAGALFTLDAVEPELELLWTLLPPAPTVSFSMITSIDATKSRALCALRDNTWLHLACHGMQRSGEPFESAFLMRDQPLLLLDITQMDLSRHQFVFLSACETAVGDLSTPDEVIHLAAGLQFAGVKSVVGTLWKVDDSTVQRLVKAFYENLCGDGTMNSKRAARALHRAVQSLASDKEIPLSQRIVFVHIGI